LTTIISDMLDIYITSNHFFSVIDDNELDINVINIMHATCEIKHVESSKLYCFIRSTLFLVNIFYFIELIFIYF